ncbi:hypothetical protein U8D42_27250 (plasmid) [Mycobacterium europaeum]|uniref:Uncharacterized protein n=3 Tax=Mycobacterium TaxID=1763 RepID=A0A1X0JUR2_MYCSC|nr:MULTISPECIES: hypothetical protein [Mycobacterium]ASL12332.1 hypothetical protein MYCODSM44623_05658 [Mycobacterium intracellulare subsp. chimaera]ASL18246.1 hypothetical protein MYCOZU2_05901 [Mycobacterium intracellulare subsp. chimaera]KLO39426.1 hypothetical protein ABW17_19855 [Mycobacterium nebraskense]MCV7116578.1 hypothetical protein [Mycobacterium nebraskense]MCV7325722.1 hypothetical protein [Mycobacterium intracellulare subsp. chimaera]
MCYNRIAILGHLRTELVDGSCNPSRGLAELSAPLLVDDSFTTLLYKIADGRPLRAALLWSRIGDHLSGQSRIEALTLAAVFALKGGNPGICASLINRVDVAVRRDHTGTPAMIDVLKLDHRVQEHLPHPVA